MAEEEKVEGEQAEEVAEEAGESGGGKLVLLIGLINTLAIVGLGAMFLLKTPEPSAAPSLGPVDPSMTVDSANGIDVSKKTGAPGPKVDLGEMTVNLKDPMADRYLKVRLELELDKEETRVEVEQRLSQIKYNLQTLLSGQRVKDVNGPKNKEALRKSMIRRSNAALGGTGRITEVWPSEWVVQ
jgi:flagellar basal body-associated protein FliL